MLVSRKHKALILRSRTPERILTVIPTAKVFQHKGVDLVAVPHRVDEVRVLRNLGYKPPSPIRYHYSWPRGPSIKKPFHAQHATAEFLTFYNRGYVLNGLGSGKTQATLWAYDYLRSIGAHQKMLVVSPLSTLERTWADSVFEHFPHLHCVTLHASSKARRQKLLAQDADVYVINHHGVEVLLDDLKARHDITLVVVDEIAQAARNARTDMWKAINQLVNDKSFHRSCWGLTATPTPNDPTDAWAQAKLVTPETAPPYFNRFKAMTMRQVGPFTWLPRDDATERVHELLQPSIRFSREECVDLPPTTFVTREAPLTPEQKKAYKEMHAKLCAELEAGEVLAVNEAVKASKLVQIACGVVYDTEGNEITIPSQPRMQVTAELVEESESKAIVFVPFVSSVRVVAEYLRKTGKTVEVIYGDVKKSERDRIFSSFQKTAHPQVIVAQPRAMSHGLTLTASSTIIWYAPVTSADTYEQANGRITRPGQKFNTLIANVECTAVERRMYERLRTKQKMQNLLLDSLQKARATA